MPSSQATQHRKAVGKLEQDYLRRTVLREHGGTHHDPVAPAFIATCVRFLLGSGYHVIVEGILHTNSYGTALRQLIAEHPGPSHVYYLDVSLDETIRRHKARAEPIPITVEQMGAWYNPLDVLGVEGEHVIGETVPFEETVTAILHTSGLLHLAPLTPCPTRCPRCAQDHPPGHDPPFDATGWSGDEPRGERRW